MTLTTTVSLLALSAVACQDFREEVVEENPLAAEKPLEDESEGKADTPEAEAGEARVEVDIEGRSGSDLTGTAILTEVPNGVQVVVELENAEPGLHGFHVHERADCSAEDATSAGGHFAPRGHEHGLPDEDAHHLGDLGNIEVNEEGRAEKVIVAPNANLDEGDERSFLGRALVVHAKKDDGGQPTGHAGARIGCGEIPTPPEPKVDEAS